MVQISNINFKETTRSSGVLKCNQLSSVMPKLKDIQIPVINNIIKAGIPTIIHNAFETDQLN